MTIVGSSDLNIARMRYLIGSGRRLRMFQHIEPKRQYCAEPKSVSRVIGVSIAGIRMDKYRQSGAVEHQPGQDGRETIRRKRDLKHGLWVRPDGLIMPAAESRVGENGADALAQQRRAVAALRRVVVDMGVVGRNSFRLLNDGPAWVRLQIGHASALLKVET